MSSPPRRVNSHNPALRFRIVPLATDRLLCDVATPQHLTDAAAQSSAQNLASHAGRPIGGRKHALQRADFKIRCVDKHSGRPVGACQVSFKDLNCERQPLPSTLGAFKTTTASWTRRLTLAEDETVALGGFFAKPSLALLQPASRCAVRICPAALTGRSANTIELGATPSNVNVSPRNSHPEHSRR